MTLVLVRLGLLLVAAMLTSWLVSLFADTPFAFGHAVPFSSLYFIPVNVVCLWLVARDVRASGGRFRDLVGLRRDRLGQDLWQGLVLHIALFVPFVVAVALAVLALYGPRDMAQGFELTFAPAPAALPSLPRVFAFATAFVVALLFPITNAPAEEIYYRGHAQTRLSRAGAPAWIALLVPSVAFGAQHVLLAPTQAGMLVYALAFTVWGLGAALFYQRSGRLMPLVFAHFFTNAIAAVIPLAILLSV